MTANRGGPELELLVTTDDQSFGSAVVDAVERAGVAASAGRVEPASGGSTQRDTGEFDGAIVDGRTAEPAAVVERLTEQADLPVVVLTESGGDDDTVARAIEAGATDVFPRTAASAQCELIVDRIVGRVQDVTDRRRITRRLRAILERIDEAIYVTWAEELTTPSLHPDDFYAGYEDVWGQPLEEIFETYEEGFLETLHPEEQEGFRSFLADIGADLDSGSVSDHYSHEYRIERASGEHRWIRSDFYPTEWETGPLRMVIVSRDVTERKRREREYEQVFNSVQDAITVHDPHTGEMVDVNDTFCELVGYDRETILEIGTTGVSAQAEGYTQEYAEEIIAEVLREGQKGPYEWMVETRDGEHRVTEVVATRGTIGGEDRIISINRDVTERKRREQEFEQIFNGVQDAIAVFDPDTLEYLDANEAYLEMFDHESVSELRERGVSGLSITEEGYTEQRGREVHQRVAESGQPELVEWQGETSGGERVWLEVKVAPAVIGGEQRTISIQRDVTERKRREQRLEVFNRILRHNLRNQLDVIRSHAEELADRTTGDHAERIVAAVDELAGIGRRARDADRILSKNETLTEVDIAQTLRETVETMAATGSDVTVTTELPKEARLRTDEETVTMAVESALENALEHAASAVTVAVEDGPDGCVITIADDGPGIPAEALRPIEAETETRLQHGRGLGLWQLRWCVDTLNGELSFETGAGTTVRLTVPDRRESGRHG
jgi:PAS domain S-box-containing protein